MAKSSSTVFVFSRFVLVGGTTAFLYFLTFWLTFSVWGWSSIASISISYAISTAFHFLANQSFTFGVGFAPRRLVRYAALWLFNYLVTVTIVYVCESLLGLSAYVGVCLSVAVTTLISFNFFRRWVFDA